MKLRYQSENHMLPSRKRTAFHPAIDRTVPYIPRSNGIIYRPPLFASWELKGKKMSYIWAPMCLLFTQILVRCIGMFLLFDAIGVGLLWISILLGGGSLFRYSAQAFLGSLFRRPSHQVPSARSILGGFRSERKFQEMCQYAKPDFGTISIFGGLFLLLLLSADRYR